MSRECKRKMDRDRVELYPTMHANFIQDNIDLMLQFPSLTSDEDP